MKDKIPAELFESLDIPRKDVSQQSRNQYRVYKDESEFITVEAENAQKALLASGIKHAHRIERHDIRFTTVLNLDTLSEPPANKGLPETPIPAIAAPPADEPSLSDEDVAKLLQG